MTAQTRIGLYQSLEPFGLDYGQMAKVGNILRATSTVPPSPPTTADASTDGCACAVWLSGKSADLASQLWQRHSALAGPPQTLIH